MYRKWWSVVTCLAATACFGIAALAAPVPTASSAKLLVGQLSRSQLLQQLNKSVELEGYFFDSSTPILVESLGLVRNEEPLPPDKYVPLGGRIPSSFKSGAKVRISGQLQRPTGDQFGGESLVLQIASGAQGSLLQPPPAALASRPTIVTATGIRPPSGIVASRYALLIGGGQTGGCNYVRYWNDLWKMYHMLLDAGYSANNIRVAYAYGAPYPYCTGMPVNYPATMSGISAAFGYFAPRVRSTDTFSVFAVGQGAAAGVAGPTAVYWGWNAQPISPGWFATQVNRIAAYRQMTIVMTQAYSGAFTTALTRPNRIIMTSAAANRVAYTHPSYWYGNFSFWYMSALCGRLITSGTPVNADANANGHVSKTEAYNFVLPRPGNGSDIPPIAAQQPQYEDNGVPPSRCAHMPAYGEGTLGANSYL